MFLPLREIFLSNSGTIKGFFLKICDFSSTSIEKIDIMDVSLRKKHPLIPPSAKLQADWTKIKKSTNLDQ